MIGLIVLGVLVFCLCCYKVTNLLYQLFTLDTQDQPDMVSPTHLDKIIDKQLDKPPPHNHTHLLQDNNDKRDPELPLSHTPRCSRHANGGGDGQPPPVYHSKEELVMANLNHFPSAGELREPGLGYSSVERLLPPYPSYTPPQSSGRSLHHRNNNGCVVGGRGYPDNPHPHYSYSYTNINSGEAENLSGDTRHPHHSHCMSSKCINQASQPPQHHHIATMRRTPVSHHHSEHPRWCNSNNVNDFHHQQSLPPSSLEHVNKSSRYPPPLHRHPPYTRQSSRESLEGPGRGSVEDREVSAMFHRDTLLARIVRL